LAAIIGLVHINNSFPDFFHFTLWPAFAYNSPTPGHKKKPQKNNKQKLEKTIEIFINTETLKKDSKKQKWRSN